VAAGAGGLRACLPLIEAGAVTAVPGAARFWDDKLQQ
jgi:hypothetical protein